MCLNKHDEYRALMSAKRQKRKVNLQNVYREMLDKQVEVKKNRQLKQRMQELQKEQFLINDQPFINGTYNTTIDCLPHEWNDPGARYLRKSMSPSMGKMSQYSNNGQTPTAFQLNKSVDHGKHELWLEGAQKALQIVTFLSKYDKINDNVIIYRFLSIRPWTLSKNYA